MKIHEVLEMNCADESLLNKRSNQPACGSYLTQSSATKRLKVTQNDHITLLIKFLSELTEEQKLIVQNLGFGSWLHITCDCNFDDLFQRLAMQFNTSTCRLELNNGFKFTFSETVVHKILGIPCGGVPIHTNPSRETFDFMNSVLKTTSPTPELLLSMISANMTEESFSRIFLLLVLSTIIAPSSKGVPSKKYYSAFVNIASVPNYNLCLFTLPFLIAHFEFLITSEYKIPTYTFPRLLLWSATMLRSFIALDTMPGETLNFGRLQMKHISATPFRDSLNENALQLPESILHYINNKLPSIHNIQDKIKLQCTSQKFWQTIVTNSIPTLESYVDDALSLFNSTITSTEIQKLAPSSVQVFAPMQLDIVQTKPAETNYILQKIPLGKYPDLQSILKSHEFLDFPGPHIYPPSFYPECSQEGIDSIIQNFSESLFITDSTKFDPLLTVGTPSTIDLALVEVFSKDPVNEINTCTVISPSEMIRDSIRNDPRWNDLNATKYQIWTQEKFSSTQWKFISANSSVSGNSLYCGPHEAEMDPFQDKTTVIQSQPSQQTNAHRFEKFVPTVQQSPPEAGTHSYITNNFEFDAPNFNAITGAIEEPVPPILTAHERRKYSDLGSSSILKPGNQSYPSMLNPSSSFLYSNSPLKPFKMNYVQPEMRFGSPINDPSLIKLMNDFEAECRRSEQDNEAGKKKKFEHFYPTNLVQQSNYMQFQQVILSTPVQMEFYKPLTAALPVLDSSQRIFQVNEVWVDQKTLTISLRSGCWMNQHSLDCYSKMLNMDQLIRGRQGLIPNTNVIKHIVQREDMELLMRPLLNHSDPICRDMLSEQRVGFSLQIANFVHLPCFVDKQWMVVTAN